MQDQLKEFRADTESVSAEEIKNTTLAVGP